MSVETAYVIFFGSGPLFLGLYHFDGVGDTGGKSIARLDDLLAGNIERNGSDLQLLGRRIHIEKCGADIVFNALPQVVEFSLTLLANRFGLDDF